MSNSVETKGRQEEEEEEEEDGRVKRSIEIERGNPLDCIFLVSNLGDITINFVTISVFAQNSFYFCVDNVP